MTSFKELGIQVNRTTFTGEKIRIARVFDKLITVLDFKIEDSTAYPDKGSGKCLHLQISLNGENRIIFTSSSYLMDAIIQIPKDKFPFTTTIIEENKAIRFT